MSGGVTVKSKTSFNASIAQGLFRSRSIFYPDSENVMGWDISEEGFRIVLSADVPEVVRRHLRRDVDEFLTDHGLSRDDVSVWVSPRNHGGQNTRSGILRRDARHGARFLLGTGLAPMVTKSRIRGKRPRGVCGLL